MQLQHTQGRYSKTLPSMHDGRGTFAYLQDGQHAIASTLPWLEALVDQVAVVQAGEAR